MKANPLQTPRGQQKDFLGGPRTRKWIGSSAKILASFWLLFALLLTKASQRLARRKAGSTAENVKNHCSSVSHLARRWSAALQNLTFFFQNL